MDSRLHAAIDTILRVAIRDHAPSERWPESEAIVAYIRGDATSSQNEVIQEALSRSATFRQSFVHLAAQIEDFESAESKHAYDRVKVPKLKFLDAHIGTALRIETTLWQKLMQAIPRPQVMGSAIAYATAALIALLIIPPLMDNDSPITLSEYSMLDRSMFIGGTMRSSDPLLSPSTTAPDSAAMYAIRACVQFDLLTGEFEISIAEAAESSTDNFQELVVTFVDPQGHVISESIVSIPASAKQAPMLTGWLMVPPDLTLWQFELSDSQNANVRWSSLLDHRGVLTIVYQTSTGFEATRCVAIDFGTP